MRRGLTVIEMLIGMAIAASLLAGLFASIHSSVDAYERSAADGVNRLTSRLLVERIAYLLKILVSALNIRLLRLAKNHTPRRCRH